MCHVQNLDSAPMKKTWISIVTRCDWMTRKHHVLTVAHMYNICVCR